MNFSREQKASHYIFDAGYSVRRLVPNEVSLGTRIQGATLSGRTDLPQNAALYFVHVCFIIFLQFFVVKYAGNQAKLILFSVHLYRIITATP